MTDFPHLPPGHAPGAQSLRNRRGAPLLWWFVGIVGAAMFVAGVFVAAGGRGSKFDPVEELIGGIFFGGFGLLCAGVAYSQYRKFKPLRLHRRISGVSLAVDRDEAACGETLSVTITRARPVDELEVGLVCVERYDVQANARTKGGTITVRQTNEAHAHEHWQRIEPGRGEQLLTFEIPRDAPCSYEGDCVSFAWRVSARQVRRLRSDPRVDHPVWVRA